MNILFIHQNFPGQFKFLAPALVKDGHKVVALTMKNNSSTAWQGIELKAYASARSTTPNVHPWVSDLETKIIRGEACLLAAIKLKESGFAPDVIIAHPGWGESLFLKEVWPQAKLGIYGEFYYQKQGADTGFDPEFPIKNALLEACRLRLKNLNNLLHFETADLGISPTHWQASTFPDPFRSKITVIHDGIDTQALVPNPSVKMKIKSSSGEELQLTRNDEIISFVNRNLEPYRGYHVFMRALPALLKRRTNARVLIIGGNDVSYGSRPDKAKYGHSNWKDIYIDEVRDQISDDDWARVHFLGHIPYTQFVSLLQLSTVHVYLTYPFVLSWSLLEAMSVGCAIVASDTQPLQEAVKHNETGKLVNFFEHTILVDEVCELLEQPQERARLGNNARQYAQQHYDLSTVCLPAQKAWVRHLADV
jgi:glycosyltransferase involved in cell wall biosynthesis